MRTRVSGMLSGMLLDPGMKLRCLTLAGTLGLTLISTSRCRQSISVKDEPFTRHPPKVARCHGCLIGIRHSVLCAGRARVGA